MHVRRIERCDIVLTEASGTADDASGHAQYATLVGVMIDRVGRLVAC
jgi:hypothetical protein